MGRIESLKKKVAHLLTPVEIKAARALLTSQGKDPSNVNAVKDISILLVTAARAAQLPGAELISKTLSRAIMNRVIQAEDKTVRGDTIDS
ncbi:hypothetical protein HYS82_02000 [Candidatus Amesbacteria bacterium]|nr:hypothetical protein [Candidatus Amesbacteria bacterium]MBI2587208.1 hypothetical protein [Candidatus Amesbacteria bacterium]